MNETWVYVIQIFHNIKEGSSLESHTICVTESLWSLQMEYGSIFPRGLIVCTYCKFARLVLSFFLHNWQNVIIGARVAWCKCHLFVCSCKGVLIFHVTTTYTLTLTQLQPPTYWNIARIANAVQVTLCKSLLLNECHGSSFAIYQ